MAVFRQVHIKFWTDVMVLEEMTPEDKYFYLYLLTNPHTNQIGVYQLPKKIIGFELGYSIESVNSLVQRFEDHYKIIKYNKETREIALLNWGKYNLNRGGKPMEDLIKKELKEVKDISLVKEVIKKIQNESIKEFIYKLLDHCDEEVDEVEQVEPVDEEESLSEDVQPEVSNSIDNIIESYIPEEAIGESKSSSKNIDNTPVKNNDENHIKNNKPTKDKGIYFSIIQYLNQMAGTQFKPNTKKTQQLISARLKEGFTLEDFKIVINKKVKEWTNTEMDKYLRPETLFGTKFEGYLNQKEIIRINNTKNKSAFCNYPQRKYDGSDGGKTLAEIEEILNRKQKI